MIISTFGSQFCTMRSKINASRAIGPIRSPLVSLITPLQNLSASPARLRHLLSFSARRASEIQDKHFETWGVSRVWPDSLALLVASATWRSHNSCVTPQPGGWVDFSSASSTCEISGILLYLFLKPVIPFCCKCIQFRQLQFDSHFPRS